MTGKFDSFRDSALHFLCSSDWANESFGDVTTYGVYIWRITLERNDVFGCFDQGNMEFDSLLSIFSESEGIDITQELKESLVGHFMVSENEQGLVTVKKYTLESELIRHFNLMKEHYLEWDEANFQEGN